MVNTSQEILRLEGVQKWVGEDSSRLLILRGISFVVNAGEFVAIMGASGSGKSTLMNLIGLLDSPSAGTLSVLGQEVSRLSEDRLARLRAESIGFIFQSFNLLPYLNAQENVELPMSYAHARDTQRERSGQLLSEMQLSHRSGAYPATLSGGERQRVAIARSLVNHPKLLLADDPTGALDSKTGIQIMNLLEGLHRQGMTLIVVTHDESVAKRAGRIIRMKDGLLD